MLGLKLIHVSKKGPWSQLFRATEHAQNDTWLIQCAALTTKIDMILSFWVFLVIMIKLYNANWLGRSRGDAYFYIRVTSFFKGLLVITSAELLITLHVMPGLWTHYVMWNSNPACYFQSKNKNAAERTWSFLADLPCYTCECVVG